MSRYTTPSHNHPINLLPTLRWTFKLRIHEGPSLIFHSESKLLTLWSECLDFADPYGFQPLVPPQFPLSCVPLQCAEHLIRIAAHVLDDFAPLEFGNDKPRSKDKADIQELALWEDRYSCPNRRHAVLETATKLPIMSAVMKRLSIAPSQSHIGM